LGKDGLCRLLFYETRLLYQLLTRNLVKWCVIRNGKLNYTNFQ
jgi:hypothetical protein